MAVPQTAYNTLMGMFNPQQPAAGASIMEQAQADARKQMLSRLGFGLLAAAIPQTATQRTQALQQAFGGMGDMNTAAYNNAQARLMAQKTESEARRLAADEAWLRERGLSPQTDAVSATQPVVSLPGSITDTSARRLMQPMPPSVSPVPSAATALPGTAGANVAASSVLTPEDIRLINENIPPSERADFTRDLIRQRMTQRATPVKPPQAPSGFRWKDETYSELEPIPGGPGTQMPAELGARIGLAKSFIKSDLQEVKKSVDSQFTDEWTAKDALSRAQLAAGYGEEGEIYRRVQSGIDALMRMLTGAGLTASERGVYESRYLPSPSDSRATMQRKLDGLEKDLQATIDVVSRGRGGADAGEEKPATESAPQAEEQQGSVDYSSSVGKPSGYPDGYEAVDSNNNVVLVSRNGKWELP